jgi:ankyrin repeat protein
VGSFTVHGELIVADRCYVKSRRPDLAHRFPAKTGVWHAWTRADPEETGMTALLIAAHENHLALANNGWCCWDDVPPLGADVPVDTATVTFVDAARFDSDSSFRRAVEDAQCPDEQIALGGSGCIASSGRGDGLYPLGVETSRGVAVAVQVAFVLPDEEDDEESASSGPPVTKNGQPRNRLGAATPALHEAVDAGDLRAVRRLIRGGAKVNALNELGQTAVHRAAFRGDVKMLTILRDSGANLLARDELGETALCHAAFKGFSPVVKAILAAGANPNDRAGSARATPLHSAAFGNQAAVIDQLLTASARPNIRDAYGYTPLMNAAAAPGEEAARVLLEHATTQHRSEALLVAADYGHLEMVKLLIAGGADPNYRSKYGKTALMHARMSKHRRARSVVKHLTSMTTAAAGHAASTGPVVQEEGATDG